MVFYILTGIFSALAILFLLFKFNIKKVLAFDIAVDIASSFLLVVLFAGTFAGMMSAVIGGAIISIVLYVLKKIRGYEKPIRKGLRVVWVSVPPK
ncbi:MAG: hypothetical protein CBC24_09125 [Candidatus Pelagibacter sp. TMED64]|nr:MAG: hypothetical protein CBC24_09125 [Candidatus Pelagibacter sp. TMED64]|tara:strand:+ start:2116 stop:2400 length:285 start_codon:yes stop_codon:yes gene_type:complete